MIHASFIELGTFLQNEAAWLCTGILRTSVAKKILGKESACFKAYFEFAFLGTESISAVGIAIDIGHGPFLFYAVHGRMPYDEAAEKQVWDVKGASGLIPCYECRNVVLKQEGRCLANFDNTGYLQPLSCTGVSKFDRMTDELVWSTYDCLAARRGEDAANAQKMCGINVNPYGLLACVALRLHIKPSSSHRDPMHVVLCNGVAQWEVYLLIRSLLRKTPFTIIQLREFSETLDFQFPASRTVKKNCWVEMFSDKRIKASMEAKCFKCGASEMLAIYPILLYFVEVVVVASGALAPESASYVELCGVVDLMQRAKLHGVDAETLRGIRDKSREFFKLTQAAYGTEHIMPKHHYFVCPTFTRQAEEDGVWMDCFPTERKGIYIKNGLDPCDNTTSFERSTLLRALAHTFGSAESGMVDGLLGFAMHCPVLSSALGVPTEVSRACCYHGLSFGI